MIESSESKNRNRVREHYAIGHHDYDAPRLHTLRGRTLSEHDLALFSELYRSAALADDHRALEVAAGTGRFTLEALVHAGRTVATDINESLLAGLRERLSDIDEHRVDTRVEDAFSLSFDDGEFDAVYAIHFIPRLLTASDQAVGIAEMARVLRPGGRLIINMRNRRSRLYGRAYEGHAISVEEMTTMLRAAGLRPLEWRVKHLLTRRLLDLVPDFLIPALRKIDWRLRTWQPERAWDVFVLAEKPENA